MAEKFDPAAAVKQMLGGKDEDFDAAGAVRRAQDLPPLPGAPATPRLPPGPGLPSRIMRGRPGTLAGSMLGGLRGGAAGGRAGAGFGPLGQLGGMLAGGGLGAMAGYWGDEFLLDMARRFKIDETLEKAPSFSTRLEQSGKVFVNDMMYGQAAASFGPVVRLGIKGLGSVTARGIDIAKRAQGVGINLSIADVTEGNIIPWVTTIFGKFPLVARPITGHAKTLATEINQAADRLFLAMAPIGAMGKMGRRIDRIADAHFRLFRRVINKEYTEVLDQARQTGSEVPVGPAVKVADDFLDTLRRGRSEAAVRKHPFFSWWSSEIGPPSKAAFQEGATTTSPQHGVRTREYMSVDRAVGLIQSFEEIIAQTKDQGFNWKEFVEPFHNAVAKSMAEVTTMMRDPATGEVTRTVNKRLSEMWSKVDAKFSGIMKEIFETRVARSLGRISGGRFSPATITKENPRPPEYTIRILSENNVKTSWDSLAKLIPGKRVAWVAGHWLNDAFQRSMKFDAETPSGLGIFASEKGQFSLAEWFKRTGMDDPRSAAFEGTMTALKKAGMSTKAFVAFNEALVSGVRSSVPNVSSFIARKVNISGISAIRSIMLPGATAAGAGGFAQGELATAASILMIGNTFAAIVSSPKIMQMAMKGLDTNADIAVRKMAIHGLIKIWEASIFRDTAQRAKEVGEALEFPVIRGAIEGISNIIEGAGDLIERKLN
jgi:hypothetical protein